MCCWLSLLLTAFVVDIGGGGGGCVAVRLYVFDGFAAGCVRCCCCLNVLLMLVVVVVLGVFAFGVVGFVIVDRVRCCCLRLWLVLVVVVVC